MKSDITKSSITSLVIAVVGICAVALLISGCSLKAERIDLADVSAPQSVTLAKRPKQGHVHGLSIWLNGKIEGQATVALILNDSPYQPMTITGDVEKEVRMDWYADTALVTYTPNVVKSGSLTISYRFED